MVSKVVNTNIGTWRKIVAGATAVKTKIKMLGIIAYLFVMLPVEQVFATAGGNAGTAFITGALAQLGTVIVAIGAGLGIFGIVNLLEGYGQDNPGAKSQGIKQLMAGGGLILIGVFVPGALGTLFA